MPERIVYDVWVEISREETSGTTYLPRFMVSVYQDEREGAERAANYAARLVKGLHERQSGETVVITVFPSERSAVGHTGQVIWGDSGEVYQEH